MCRHQHEAYAAAEAALKFDIGKRMKKGREWAQQLYTPYKLAVVVFVITALEELVVALFRTSDVTVDQRVRGVSIRGALAANVSRDGVVWTRAGTAVVPEENRKIAEAVVPATL